MNHFLKSTIDWYKIMRVTLSQLIIVMVFTGISLAEDSKAQEVLDKKVTVRVERTPIVDVLKQLEKKADVKFVYSPNIISGEQTVSISAKNDRLKQVLDQLLLPNNISYEVINKRIVLGPKSLSGENVMQSALTVNKYDIPLLQQLVEGKVTDAEGQPLPGATVEVKGTNRAVSSDIDGAFSIEAEKGDVLLISFMGFVSKEVTVGDNTNITVQLQADVSKLDQVVVVGYGTQKKVNLTGAVSSIDAETLEDRPVSNITQAIQGAIPNLNVTFGDGRPGSEGSLNIRGNTSLNGGSPLVLIDGVPGDINSVNPRDVASISVLKDAASSAIYGGRGSFGVVLVTTKKGKKGKLTINYGTNFGWSSPTVSTDFMTSGYDVAKLVDEAFLRAVGKTYTGYTDEDYEELKKRKTDPSLPSAIIDNRKGKDMFVHYGNTDWWNTMFRNTQTSMEHSLSFMGGGDKVDFYLSGRFYQKNGMMRINQDKYDSYNLRAKINARLTDWLTINSNTRFNTSKYTYPGWGVNRNFVYVTVHALPSYLPINPDGTATYRTELNNYTIGDGVFADLLHGKSKGGENESEFISTIGATLKLTDGLEVIGNYTYNLNPSSDFLRRTEAPWSIFPGVVSYLGYDQYSETMYKDQSHVINAYANYSKNFGEHSFRITAGYNQELYKYKRVFAQRKDLLSEDLNDLGLGTGDQEVDGSIYNWALQGAFYRLSYNYAGKYLFEINGRYDGTSKFPEEKRFGFFPSVSAGWRLSEESFFEPLKTVVNNLKFRASYGSLGNQSGVGAYDYIPLMRIGDHSFLMDGNRTEFLSAPYPISPDLTWEKVTSTNFGVDLGMMKNRLTFSFDWYNRETIGMLTESKTLPAVFGAPEPQENAADLLTKGWGLELGWQNDSKLAGKPFSYNVRFVLSDYKGEITRFDNPSELLSDHYVGQQLGEMWGYSVDGYFATDEEAAAYPVDQSRVNNQRLGSPGEWSKLMAGDMKFRDLDGDGAINNGKNTLGDHGDLIRIGNSQPRYSFGFSGGVNWNGFDLSAFFQGIGKQDWYPGDNADKFWGPYSRPYFSFIPEGFQEKIWSPENPNAYFPNLRGYVALGGGDELSVWNDKYVQDLAYIRLKNLTIGYSLPASVLSKISMSRCRIYISGENLFTLTKLDTKYIDPEQASAEKNGRVYPFGKTYSFGLDISF